MKFLLILLVCVSLVGCGSPMNNASNNGQTTDTGAYQYTSTPNSTMPQDNPELQEGDPNPLAGWAAVSGNLTVSLSIQDMQVVDQSPWLLNGITTPSAVVSINDIILLADQKGLFSTEVVLEDGANTLEVVVSDTQGNLIEAILTLFYEGPN